jgi:MFS family permease
MDAGVIGVSKTYIGLITDETNEAQAFGFLALCWGTGGVIGPAIGGLLAQVCRAPVLQMRAARGRAGHC